jgi:hypothetical protein
MRMFRGLVLVLVSELLCAASAAAEVTTLTGTITLHGCVAQASDFHLQAAPTTTVDPSRAFVRGGSGGGSATAQVSATSANGRDFEFRFSRLAAGQPYLLDLRLLGRGCEKVFWRGLTPGRVLGGGLPVAIHGYAARTRVEILGEAIGRPARKWVGADHLDFTDPIAGIRRLRVQTDLPGVTRVVLQVATEPFRTGGRDAEASCESDDETVIRRLEFPVAPGGAWAELPPIDFHALLAGGRRIDDGDMGRTDALLGSDVPPIPEHTLRMLGLGAPLYLRAIAVSEDESGTVRRRCDTDTDGVAGWVKLVKLAAGALTKDPPPPPLGLRIYSALYKGPTIHPWPGPNHQYCVRAVQEHSISDVPKTWLALFHPDEYDFVTAKNSKWAPGGTIKVGDGICYDKSSSGGSNWVDLGVGLVTGAIDGVGMLVDSASRLWESVKQAVANIAASVITAVGVPCNATCKTLLTTGLNIAMASAGIPPTLPNMSALKQDAIEYVAAQVADQSPVPGTGVLVEHALEYAVESVEQYAKQGGGGGLPNWLTMDLGLVPATMKLRVERFHVPPANRYSFYAWSSVMIGATPVYALQFVDLPRRFWTKGFPPPNSPDLLTIPVVLQPNLSKVPPPPMTEVFGVKLDYYVAFWNKQHWAAGLAADPCVAFPFVWWLSSPLPPHQPLLSLGFLGALATPTFVTADFNGPLAAPANVSYCP